MPRRSSWASATDRSLLSTWLGPIGNCATRHARAACLPRRCATRTRSAVHMTLALALAGLLAGFIHVLSGPDHLAAIAPYAVEGRTRAWKIGRTLGNGTQCRRPRRRSPRAARAPRVTPRRIVGVGRTWRRCRADRHRRVAACARRSRCVLTTRHPTSTAARPLPWALSMAWPAARHLLGVVPALALPSDLAASAYLALFGAGTVAAMGTFSSLVGWIASHPRASARGTQSAPARGLRRVRHRRRRLLALLGFGVTHQRNQT